MFKKIITLSNKKIKNKWENYFLRKNLKVRRLIDYSGGLFFGYYDISPFSNDNEMILGHRVRSGVYSPQNRDTAEIGFIKLQSSKPIFIKLAESNAWSWQLGARLRWFPNKQNEIIYNDVIDGQAVSVHFPIDNPLRRKVIRSSLYDICPSGLTGLTLNFSRLQRLRPGYGFKPELDSSVNYLETDSDGLYLVDLENDKSNLLYSISDVVRKFPHESMINANHYFNHISINQIGSHFIFYHVWNTQDGKRFTRVFVSDMLGQNLRVLYNGPKVSHYCWVDEKTVLLVVIFGRIIKYCLFDINFGIKEIIGDSSLKNDGHPTFTKSKEYLLNDTYPIYNNHQQLMLFHIGTNRLIRLKKYYSPPQYRGEFKCDLHPRLSHDNSYVCVDTVWKNKRCMEIIQLPISI